MSLLLVRHGQAQSNVSKILTSYPEVKPMPLSEKGRKQVKESAHALKGVPIVAIFASPLTRTQETAQIISEAVGVPVITDVRLRETDFGVYNNTSSTKFFLRYPFPWMRRVMSKQSEAEGLILVQKRVKEFLSAIREPYAGQTVVLVTHSVVIHELLSLLSGRIHYVVPIAKGKVYRASLTSATKLD